MSFSAAGAKHWGGGSQKNPFWQKWESQKSNRRGVDPLPLLLLEERMLFRASHYSGMGCEAGAGSRCGLWHATGGGGPWHPPGGASGAERPSPSRPAPTPHSPPPYAPHGPPFHRLPAPPDPYIHLTLTLAAPPPTFITSLHSPHFTGPPPPLSPRASPALQLWP